MNDMNKLPKLTLSIKRPVIDSSLKSKVVVVNKIDKEIESNVVFNSVLKAKLVVSEQSIVKPKQSNKNLDITVSETPKKVVEVVKVETDKFTYKLYWKVLEYVRLKYPNCFTVPPVPLAIGIHKELINLNILIDFNISKKQLDSFFYFYCNTPEYKEKIESGVERVGLKLNKENL